MRLIDADEFGAHIMSVAMQKGICDDCLYTFLDELSEAPTVDPMKHGRWVTNGEDDGVVYCDQCLMPQDTWSDFCPSCGAMKDGGEHNGNSSDTLKTGQ